MRKYKGWQTQIKSAVRSGSIEEEMELDWTYTEEGGLQ